MKARFPIAGSMLLLFVATARAGDAEDNTLDHRGQSRRAGQLLSRMITP
jgi:hypothetical protein